jgi:hypothetical protein
MLAQPGYFLAISFFLNFRLLPASAKKQDFQNRISNALN